MMEKEDCSQHFLVGFLFQLWIFAVQNKFQQPVEWNSFRAKCRCDTFILFRRRNAADFIFKTATAVHS
jgi:hypothetical protein